MQNILNTIQEIKNLVEKNLKKQNKHTSS